MFKRVEYLYRLNGSKLYVVRMGLNDDHKRIILYLLFQNFKSKALQWGRKKRTSLYENHILDWLGA